MASKKSNLRAVAPDEAAPQKRKAMSITRAADDGDRLKLLVALRARIARAVEDPNTPPRDLAALSRRLLEIARDIEAIEADIQEDDIGAAAGTPDEEWSAG